TTPKPMVQGPQTAIVVGPSGEEIYTDKYARVKVSFHWDRNSKSDENSSCWVRVAQVWAGTKWGGIQIPRIGQEVIIEFLEGDPDQPIITGRVYNNDNMPPYDLPANATQSGIKSRSSKGGNADNFNEIRFEDKKGDELVYIHAEKDQSNVVENDETISIGNNRDKNVGVNQTESIGTNKTITVGGNHAESITGNMTQSVSLAKAETITLAKALTIGAGYQVTVGAAMNETIGGLKAEEIGALKSVNVVANSSENVGGNKSVDADKDISATSGKKMSFKAGDDYSVKGDKNGVIDIKDQLTIKVGKASITMKKNGDITINGKTINIKGSGNIVMKAKKILEN
ncbi:MAG: type VI secretion system tip protein VgrG, partial [Desulfobacterales bacterium]|nr:type VI secretion system tip protein VgrG [Desulfobacterales bacterium]